MDAGFTQSYAKFRPCMPKNFSRASSDTYRKWLLGPDQDLVFTFSNPTLKSALYTEVHFASLFSGEFTTMAGINPPEKEKG